MRSTLRAACTIALAGVVAAGITPGARAQADTAYVVAAQGHWVVQGHKRPLAVGSPLVLPARLQAQQPEAGDRIVVIAARSGAVLGERHCASAADCRAPLVLAPPSGAAAGTGWGDTLARVMARLEAAPDRYVSTLSRSEAGLQDALIVLHGPTLDLAPALATLPAGRYQVTLQGPDCDAGASPCSVWQQQLTWQPGGAALLAAPAQPGVHELRVRVSTPGAPGPWQARVLLLRPDDAAARVERYREWTGRVRAWGGTLDAAARRSLLRAVMDDIAAQP